MAKKSVIQRNLKRLCLSRLYQKKRDSLRKQRNSKAISIENRFRLTYQLSVLPRNSAVVRVRNRCKLSGRGRGVYRKFGLSRINIRSLASMGLLPGVMKASW